MNKIIIVAVILSCFIGLPLLRLVCFLGEKVGRKLREKKE